MTTSNAHRHLRRARSGTLAPFPAPTPAAARQPIPHIPSAKERLAAVRAAVEQRHTKRDNDSKEKP
jgi:hypothetical protein